MKERVHSAFSSYSVGIAVGTLGTLAAVLLLVLGFMVAKEERDLLEDHIIEIPVPAEAQPVTIPKAGKYVLYVTQNSVNQSSSPGEPVTSVLADADGTKVALSDPPGDVVRLTRWYESVRPVAVFSAKAGTYLVTAESATGRPGIHSVQIGPLMHKRWPSGVAVALLILAISCLTSLVILVRATVLRRRRLASVDGHLTQ